MTQRAHANCPDGRERPSSPLLLPSLPRKGRKNSPINDKPLFRDINPWDLATIQLKNDFRLTECRKIFY